MSFCHRWGDAAGSCRAAGRQRGTSAPAPSHWLRDIAGGGDASGRVQVFRVRRVIKEQNLPQSTAESTAATAKIEDTSYPLPDRRLGFPGFPMPPHLVPHFSLCYQTRNSQFKIQQTSETKGKSFIRARLVCFLPPASHHIFLGFFVTVKESWRGLGSAFLIKNPLLDKTRTVCSGAACPCKALAGVLTDVFCHLSKVWKL